MKMRNFTMETASRRRFVNAFTAGVFASLAQFTAGGLHAAPGTLSQTPLFLAKAVQPNIFFLLDDSGSMDWEVLRSYDGDDGNQYLDYTPDWDSMILEHCVGYNVLAYDPGKTYTPWHGKDKDGNTFADQNPKSAMVNPYTGDGSTESCNSYGRIYNGNGRTCDLTSDFTSKGAFYVPWKDTDLDLEYDDGECSTNPDDWVYVSDMNAEDQVDFANWFSYYRKREYVMKRAVSEIVDDSTDRIGMATINRNNNVSTGKEVGTQVKNMDDETLPVNATAVADKATLLHNLLGINSSSSTPLRRGLQHVGEYFMDDMDSSALFDYTPSNQSDSASGHSPILTEALGGTCQQNFAIVMSDGFWNGGDPSPAIGNTDQNGDGDFDGQSYADTRSDTLADVAMHYYETDLLTSLDNEVPAVAIDPAPGDEAECDAVSFSQAADHPNCFDTNSQQHLVTFTVAFGVRGSIPETDAVGAACIPAHRDESLSTQKWPSSCDASLSDGWPTPVKNTSTTVDDMMHAAWNGRGEFLSAKNPAQLIESLKEAINEISSRKTVAAAAVAVDTTDITGGGYFYQAKFDSSNWSGELYKYYIDKTTTGPSPVWNAHDKLDTRAYTSRFLVTYNGSQGVAFDFPDKYQSLGTSDLSQSQVKDLLYNAPYDAATTAASEIAANKAYGEKLVAYLQGDTTNEGADDGDFRDRDKHKMGDIVHSSPVYVGDPDPRFDSSTSYQTWANTTAKGRQEMIYVGANDGALHAFNADTGAEVFAYYPQAIFSDVETGGLHWLAKQTYEHRYYVDGEIITAEVFVQLEGETSKSWHTILIGALRGGGKAIYAIDVSDPSEFATEAGVAGNILWEFSHDDLGYTFGIPTVAKLNNGRWAAIFGNGYNAAGASANGQAALFIKYLDDPDPAAVEIIYTGSGTIDAVSQDCTDAASDCNGLSAPAVVDLGADNVADRAYAGDVKGNLWAFDLSSSSASSWAVENSAPLFIAESASGARQPITSQPYVVRHPTERHGSTDPNTMVFFGTGQYITETDPASTGNNTFYGIWDSGANITGDRDTVLVSQSTDDDTLSGEDVRLLSNNPVDYTTARGWYYDLPDTGERVIYNPIVVGELVIYTTIVPESNLCSGAGGYSWLMVHNFADGSEPNFIAIDVTGDGNFDSQDQVGDDNVGGVKYGSLVGPMTFVKTGSNQGEVLLPDDNEDPALSRGGVQYGKNIGTRSSWGRYRKE